MKQSTLRVLVLLIALSSMLSPEAAGSEKRAIDLEHSVMKVHVYKSGLFSAFAHNHEIAAPIAQGEVETGETSSVALRVESAKLRVLDPELSADKRSEVQKTMEGAQVLDVRRFPEIRFLSTAVVKAGPSRWTVQGPLTLHGQTRPITVEVVQEKDGRYRGSVLLKQREFGMTPVSIAGGTVKVKDDVKIEFEVLLRP